MNTTQPARWGFLPPYISWLTIVLALLTVITFFAVLDPRTSFPVPMGGGMMEYTSGTRAVPPSAGMPGVDQNMMPDRYYPYPYPSQDVPITDTREFLKIYYNASMRTRDVPGLTARVVTTVRGYDGRIDQESSSAKYGYISFALPQSKYLAFRSELESLVGKRFLTVNISSQNLLQQKVSIEEQQKRADESLAQYKAARQKIVTAHLSAVQALEAQMAVKELSESALASLKQQLVSENARYTWQLANADANIKYAQEWQKAVQTQDSTLLANVATVSGTVSIEWIGLWDTALLYLPGFSIPTIFAVFTLLSFYRDRRRSGYLS